MIVAGNPVSHFATITRRLVEYVSARFIFLDIQRPRWPDEQCLHIHQSLFVGLTREVERWRLGCDVSYQVDPFPNLNGLVCETLKHQLKIYQGNDIFVSRITVGQYRSCCLD